MFWSLWCLCFVLLSYLFYKYAYKPSRYWDDRKVTRIYATPIFGSMASNLYKRIPFPEVLEKLYYKYPTSKYVGIMQFQKPVVMIRDPELIKHVTVKDFDYFMNHTNIITEDTEPLFGKNLLSLKGQKWKDMRSTLSPAFTGSKMRTMFHLIRNCAEQFVNYFSKEVEGKEMITIEMKDIFTRYTNDVIGTAAFGLECDSLTHKENEFYMIGKKITSPGYLALLKIFAYLLFPSIMKMLKFKFFGQEVTDYFSDLITSTLRKREAENIIRPDMIHLLMEARKGKLKHDISDFEFSNFSAVEESNIGKNQKESKALALTDEDIIAQAFLFFFAGYDTGATMMGFLAYELALNPDVQQKLQEEIDELFATNKIDYEAILKMKYLDMVVSESLRKWPPAGLTERQCEQPYKLKISNENEEAPLIEKDVSIWIPVLSIHRDPKYYEDPEKFLPERFSDENKNKIKPFTYLPFGSGPRNCIGSRFALLEIKTLFVHLLSKFEFTVVEETDIPLKFSRKLFNMTTEKGIWLGLKLRNTRE